MQRITPTLWAEIAEHLRASSDIRHGMVLRDMERGLGVEQIASSQCTTVDNAKNYMRSVKAMLDGMLPTTPSSALKAARHLPLSHGCNLSPALRSYVTSCLRQLAAINPSIRVDEPLRPGTLHDAGTLAREATESQMTACPTCHMIHAGECL